MRKLPSRAGFVGALSGLAAPMLYPGTGRAADAFTLRCSISTAPNSALVAVALRLAQAVDRRSNGQLKIEVYPSSQLGTEKESIDGLISGVIDLAAQNTTWVVPLVPSWQVFEMPFLFRNSAAGFRVLDGAIGAELFAQLEPKGIVGLLWGNTGFKEFESVTRPIATVADMKGLRMRIQNGAVFAATYQALGAIPVAIDLSETFTALQQRTAEAMDANLDAFTAGKYYTVCRYVAMSNIFFAIAPFMGSKRKIEAMPKNLQTILREESKAVSPYWRTLFAQRVADSVQFLKKEGLTFSDVSYDAFRKAVDPVYAAYQSRFGDLVDRMNRASGSAS